MARLMLLVGAWLTTFLVGLLVLVVPLRFLGLPNELRAVLWVALPLLAACWVAVLVGGRLR